MRPRPQARVHHIETSLEVLALTAGGGIDHMCYLSII